MAFKLSIYCICLFTTWLLCGCDKDIPGDNENPDNIPVEKWVETSIDITIAIADNQPQKYSRAQEEYDMPGTNQETKLSNLVLFIVNLDGIGNEIRNSANPEQVISVSYTPPPADPITGDITLSYKSRLSTGPKHIYIGANMSAEVQNRFRTSNTYTNPQETNVETVSSLVREEGVVMLGQLKTQAGNVFTIMDGKNEFQGANVKLERMVAKVLIACELNNEGYVKVNNNAGWMDLENVRFTLNNTSGRFQWNNPPAAGAVTPSDFLNALIDYDGRDTSADWMTADAATSDPNAVYQRGLYCFENGSGTSGDISLVGRGFTATYVLVAAKFVPGTIYTGGAQPQVFQDKTSAESALQNISEGDGTFWYYDNKYYNEEGRDQAVLDGIVLGDQFTKYTGGWGFYNTLIDGDNPSSSDLQWHLEKSRALRNRYYLLKVRQFIPPGSGEAVTLESSPDIQVTINYLRWVPKGGSQFIINTTE